jgi:hypothetical protein
VRLLYRVDPRRVAVLLLPVLLVAGALQPDRELPRPQPAAPLVPLRTATPEAVLPVVAWLVPVPAAVAAPASTRPIHSRSIASRTERRRTDSPTRPASPEQRGHAALRGLGYDWRALGYRVVFRPYKGGVLGTANRRTRLITIYVKPGQSELSLRTSLAHELGHALDFGHGSDQRRDTYRRIRGLSPRSAWFPCDRCNDLASPAGDFAEVFGTWLVGPGDFRSRLQAPPDARQLADLAPLFLPPGPAPAPAQAASPAPEPTATEAPDADRPPLLPPVLGPPPSPRAG